MNSRKTEGHEQVSIWFHFNNCEEIGVRKARISRRFPLNPQPIFGKKLKMKIKIFINYSQLFQFESDFTSRANSLPFSPFME